MKKISLFGDSGISKQEVEKIVSASLACFDLLEYEVEINFVDKSEIKKLNREFRRIDKETDVLSFPQPELPSRVRHLGNLVISEEMVRRKNEQVDDVIKHGLLHLLGHDHETDLKDWDKNATLINCNL